MAAVNVPVVRPPGWPARPQAVGGDRYERPQVAEAREREVVPQHAVAAARHQERHDDVGVVLPEIEIVALDIERRRTAAGRGRRAIRRRSAPTAGAHETSVSPCTSAGVNARPPAFSARMGLPVESKNETAPVTRSTRTWSLAVESVADISPGVEFPAGLFLAGALPSQACCGRRTRGLSRSTTRMTLSAKTWRRRNVPLMGITMMPSDIFSGSTGTGARTPPPGFCGELLAAVAGHILAAGRN